MEIFDLYQKSSDVNNEHFNKKLDSRLHVYKDYEKVEYDFEWLNIMEETIRYLDNILRNPNKFIINEEDVIKIELAKRVTVESIKHLSRNTNLIQDYNKKTGDVRPSKILNISKEESFETYENKFIYSLIQNMKFYIDRKKKSMQAGGSYKNDKKLEYSATTNVGKEKVDMNFTINSKVQENKNKDMEEINKRIDDLELHIKDLCTSDVYKAIDKKHISLVTSPIKKTNVIIKNVNFQYALRLWNYMQEHTDDDVKDEKNKKDYYDNDTLKKMADESFLINYLISKTLDEDDTSEVIEKEELSKKVVNNMLENLLSFNNIPLEELQKLIGEQYEVVKYKEVVSDKYVENLFKSSISKYLEMVDKIKI